MRRVFKTRNFSRWQSHSELSDTALCRAVLEMEQGLIDADLGGGIVKKRIALPGKGRRGGARTLIATNRSSRWFFVFGFEKNQQADVPIRQLRAFQELGKELLSRSEIDLVSAVRNGSLQEICDGTEGEIREQDA